MPNGIRHGPFGTVESVRWAGNFHNRLQASNTSSATEIVSAGVHDEVVLWMGPGQVLVFGDYFSYTSVVSGGAPSSGFDILLGNAINFISPADCNDNGVPDKCDLTASSSSDCNGNGVPDECEMDCNGNGQPDDCDLATGISSDCNGNTVPDECEADCNANGVPDTCDITTHVSDDCNTDLIPDECEPDCNGNGITDECDISRGTSNDCNENRVPDECDLANATSQDCNGNTLPDECDIAAGQSQDCNGNGVPDKCELRNGTRKDCNVNGILDECDMAQATGADCNGTGTLDECDLVEGLASDCNENGVPDACEIDDRTAIDCNANGIPDGCEPDCDGNGVPDDCDLTFNRFESNVGPVPVPPEGTSGTTLATIDVPVSMLVQQINVELDIVHSFDRDLTVTLTSPSGREVLLFAKVGGSGADFRSTVLDDNATAPIEVGRAPFQGSFQPLEPLAGFAGENAFGVWTLKIVDDQAGDAGLLNRWALVFPAVSTDCDGNGVLDTCQLEADSNDQIGPCRPGDLDFDGDVDLADLVRFQACFGTAEPGTVASCTAADLDADGDVDLGDYLAWLGLFTGPLGPEPVGPTANAGPDQAATVADGAATAPITLDGSASVSGDIPIIGYEWTDAGTVLGQGAIITPTLELGTHLISLVVTDEVGLSDSDEVVVVVVEPVSRRR
ncbi:MAG: proprotein convertase P-domain-containing protein [Planctomycetes bacterium]|nr:proprotein convertase P-domain-containing protein [Planctomycetota bacterium]